MLLASFQLLYQNKSFKDPPSFASLFNCNDVNSDIEFLLPDPPFTRFHGLGVSLGAALQLIHLQRTDCLLQSQGRAHQTHLQGQSRFFDRITSSDFCEVILHCNSRPQTQWHSLLIRLKTLKVIVGDPSMF